MTLERRQTEVTPGNVFNLGLPFVLQNQSLFNYWDIRTGDHMVELEGKHYGWDRATVQVAETGPGFGPPLHTHPVEEIFVLLEGEVAFGALIERFPSLSLAADPATLRWRPSSLIHGLESLPIRL